MTRPGPTAISSTKGTAAVQTNENQGNFMDQYNEGPAARGNVLAFGNGSSGLSCFHHLIPSVSPVCKPNPGRGRAKRRIVTLPPQSAAGRGELRASLGRRDEVDIWVMWRMPGKFRGGEVLTGG